MSCFGRIALIMGGTITLFMALLTIPCEPAYCSTHIGSRAWPTQRVTNATVDDLGGLPKQSMHPYSSSDAAIPIHEVESVKVIRVEPRTSMYKSQIAWTTEVQFADGELMMFRWTSHRHEMESQSIDISIFYDTMRIERLTENEISALKQK